MDKKKGNMLKDRFFLGLFLSFWMLVPFLTSSFVSSSLAACRHHIFIRQKKGGNMEGVVCRKSGKKEQFLHRLGTLPDRPAWLEADRLTIRLTRLGPLDVLLSRPKKLARRFRASVCVWERERRFFWKWFSLPYRIAKRDDETQLRKADDDVKRKIFGHSSQDVFFFFLLPVAILFIVLTELSHDLIFREIQFWPSILRDSPFFFFFGQRQFSAFKRYGLFLNPNRSISNVS